ncbi:hypothetical protein [Klebsiella pneumoniae]|uniref:hypothetical protein n=1 Tax=Klebsiella pneumoniae TaxID=573 RepID=UPI000E2B98E2|nr:hypothetical protein [Klebsiella pneumoniae]SYT75811.1 Uncharacterised protein [Klebsiella pneumoniae]
MTTDITELAQRNELLIANGQLTADLLRHLADNEIDSDYFAVVSECESYGKETDAELSITEFALRAAGYVDALVEALEKAQGMEAYWKTQCRGITDHCEELQARIAELESRIVTVKLASRRLPSDYVDGEFGNDDLAAIHNACRLECKVSVEKYLSAYGIVVKWEDE